MVEKVLMVEVTIALCLMALYRAIKWRRVRLAERETREPVKGN